MKRFRRWLFQFLCAISFTLLLLIAFAFVRSFIFVDIYDYALPSSSKTTCSAINISFENGSLGFGLERLSGQFQLPLQSTHARFKAQPDPPGLKSFAWNHWQFRPYPGVMQDSLEARVPLWLPMLLFAASPMCWVVDRWR